MTRNKAMTRAIFVGQFAILNALRAPNPCVILFGAAASVATLAHAQGGSSSVEQRFTFNIPAGPLPSVLARFAAQTGISLSFDATQIANLRSPGVQGSFPLREGLFRVLQDTGFDGVAKTDKGFVLVPAATKPQRPQPQAVPAAVMPTHAAAPAIEEKYDLGRVTVSGRSIQDASTARSATRTDALVSETPQSIQSISQETLKAQQVQSVGEALELVSAISFSRQPGADAGGNATVRGLNAPVLANGMLLLNNASAGMSLPTVAIERIDVLKGADSIVAGAMKPGGAVNIVTKRPRAEPVHEVTVEAGSRGHLLGSVDVGNPILDDKSLSYRLIAAVGGDGRTSMGYDGGRSVYVAPSIGWNVGDLKLVVGGEKNVSKSPYPESTVLTSQGPLKSDTPLGTPADRLTVDNSALYYEADWTLDEAWAVHSTARYDGGRFGNFGYQYQPYDDTGLFGGYAGLNRWTDRSGIALDNNVQAQLHWGQVAHTLLAGFSYGRMKSTNLFADSSLFIEGAAPPPPGLLPEVSGDTARTFVRSTVAYTSTFYLQDQLSFGPWHALLSISHGQAWTDVDESTTKKGAWSPTMGLLYQLNKSVGIYANANRSFTPNTATLYPDVPAPPARGRSAEAGMKFSLFDDQLTGTLSYFRSREFDTLDADPIHPGFVKLVPSTINRGVEADFTGRLSPGWLVTMSYSYRHYKNDAANSGAYVVTPNGQVVLLPGARPAHVANLWTTYDFQGEVLRGWGVGGGIRARTSYHMADFSGGDFKLSGQAQTDLTLYYRAKRWSANLGIKNVFDRRLYSDSSSSQFIETYPPRIYMLTVSTGF